jgi:hypothetical protein
MEIIDTPAALAAITDPDLCPILDRFADMMELATIYIIDCSDTLGSLETARGFAFDLFEYVQVHPGGWYEAVFIISDDGAGHVVIVPDRPCINPDLLALCRAAATSGDAMIVF